MDWFAPKYRDNPNEKVWSLYEGVAHGGRSVSSIVKKSRTEDKLERSSVYGPEIARGQGGYVGHFILGGMETTLDEMQYIMEAKREKKFEPRRGPGEIVQMCELLQERRNDAIRQARKHPSEQPKRAKTPFYLPRGYRLVQTEVPGLQVGVKD